MTIQKDNVDSAQQLLRHVADHVQVVVWEADADARIIYLNPASMTTVAKLPEINILDWLQFIHPDDLESAVAAIRVARAELREYQVDYRIVRSDGSTRWMMSAASPRFFADGRHKGYIGTLVDVSEHHDARARLIKSEAVHRLLTENAHDMISHSDTDNIYVYASPSHKDTLGYDPPELVGTRLYDYIHPDDLAADLEAARTGARRRLSNVRFRHKNGDWVWIGASTRAVRDRQSGEKLGIVSIARDITAQLEAERELARREERFRSLTSLSSDWYWETDTDIRFTFFSEGIYNRLRINAQHLLGSSFDAHVQDPSAPGFVAAMDAVKARRPFHDLIYPAEWAAHPGIVRFLRISGEPFSENGVFCGYRGVSRDVTHEVRTARSLERLATCDALTELPNRAMLEKRLKQRLTNPREGVCEAVFFIDLDNFKEVNDSLGHGAGDILLKEIAARLRQCVRPDDMVARLGGDEFVVLAECRNGDTSAISIAEKLSTALDTPVIIAGHEVKAAASVGISMYPQDGDTSEALLRNADTALYRAKASGGNAYCFFTPEMGEASRARLLMQGALRHALERDEFEVFYQPRVNLRTMEMTGMEALLRWTHPQLGAVPPAQFIPLAEESGLIDEIGGWVIQHAAAQAQQWSIRYRKPLKVSVNLSARQLRSRKLLTLVKQSLQVSGLPVHQMELELTESGLMEDPELAAGLLKELKALGLKLSVDDFGTGYSSLAYLCRFPLDSLKLDRSFLLQQQSEAVNTWKLAEAIINLAHTLNLSVVAEGVESEEHLKFLSNTSCDEVQGSCISKPLSPLEFEQLLRETSLYLHTSQR
ncbi:sensor domain-containing protein [Noviherbaspirillum autotrophicum]|uniref:sensor domain-containing protein n=1 Tax=Noviherbaspirillum autotrophicum TaxID=709839 RepID=UPI000A749BDC|nr:bifunctional diguanylate cyclase/phosphodiesterase [Noviherbaspirillum autotrophicum]